MVRCNVKKILLIIVVIICFSLIVFSLFIKSLGEVRAEILDIEVRDYEMHYSDYNTYAIEPDCQMEDVKLIGLKCRIYNHSYKRLHDVVMRFHNPEQIPKFILGNAIDTGLPWTVSVNRNSEKTVEYFFLVNGLEGDKEQVLAAIQSVQVDIVERKIIQNQIQEKLLFTMPLQIHMG